MKLNSAIGVSCRHARRRHQADPLLVVLEARKVDFAHGWHLRVVGAALPGSDNLGTRTALVGLAWLWLRHQPRGVLSDWVAGRVGNQRGRFRRATVVALARKLRVTLWRYLEIGLVRQKATLRARPGQQRKPLWYNPDSTDVPWTRGGSGLADVCRLPATALPSTRPTTRDSRCSTRRHSWRSLVTLDVNAAIRGR
jgi:hypothetical protein